MTLHDNRSPIQTIYFGPPGCGKSYRVRTVAKEILNIDKQSVFLVETTFHPETTYGDFVAKLLPYSAPLRQKYAIRATNPGFDGMELEETQKSDRVSYRVHAGPLIRALALAYCEYSRKQEAPAQNVLLVIDEINRGNCAQIFGDIFQLLDRNEEAWSQYAIELSDLTRQALLQELENIGAREQDLPDALYVGDPQAGERRIKLRLPPNLSIIATMNTSDESIYYMDTAFKRRWDFEYIPWDGGSGATPPGTQRDAVIEGPEGCRWIDFLSRLNDFIAQSFIDRPVDDKQVGLWFIRANGLQPKYWLDQRERQEALRVDLAEIVELSRTVPVAASLFAVWRGAFKKATAFNGRRQGSQAGTPKARTLYNYSIKQEFEDYGLHWPESASECKPSELASKLIPEIDKALQQSPTVPVPVISRAAIRNKLLFFLWDNVFSRERTKLFKKIGIDARDAAPRTFGEFATEENVGKLIQSLMLSPAK
jgi:5-methylcytosine-specific restriction enzyme B